MQPEASYPTPAPEEDNGSPEKSACIIVVIIFVVLVLAGVGVWYYLKKKPNFFNKIPPPEDKKIGQEIKKKDPNLVSAKEGGKVLFKDHLGREVEVIVPAFALPKDTKIEIERVSAGEVTDLYHFKPDGLKFLKPVTLVIPYKESGLREGETPYDIDLEYWFKEKYGTRKMLNFTVDKVTKTLRAQVREF